MVEQRPSHNLSPQLCAVLGSLNVNLESELNRYRRNRRLDGLAEEDLFADLDEEIFGTNLADGMFENNIVPLPLAMPAAAPPPVPRNRRLLAEAPGSAESANPNPLDMEESGNFQAVNEPPKIASNEAYGQLATQRYGAPKPADLEPPAALPILADESSPFSSSLVPGSMVRTTEVSTADGEASSDADTLSGDSARQIAPTGYLESSEKLIESLEDLPSLPDPVNLNRKPKRKTVSLLAGASLGFFGLVAGLGASYLMANPAVTQRIASNFQRQDSQIATNQPAKSFDPPGPDLSANEFIDLELDNLSSLKMPSTGVNPALAGGENAPAASTSLPPIEQGIEQSTGQPDANGAIAPASPANSAASVPAAAPAIETQAVVVPIGLTYYVTAPFNTDQDLIKIRESISEAFVRQFVSGNKIQIAAFDNPEAAQQFVQELSDQQITAQIYGPTAE